MKRRAGWRVDCKWIAGVIFTLSLIVVIIVYSLYQVTSFQQTKSIIKIAVEKELKEAVAQSYNLIIALALINPEQSLPTENMPIKIELKGKDIIGKSQDELVTYLIDKIAAQIYNEGTSFEGKDISSSEPSGPQTSSPLESNFLIRLAGFFNAKTHRTLGVAFVITLVTALLFLALLVGSSYRFGRLISPAISFLVVGLAGIIISSPARLGASVPNQLSKMAAKPITNFFNTSLTLLAVGATLVVIGVIGNIILRAVFNKEKSS